jgi:hypothetical protein
MLSRPARRRRGVTPPRAAKAWHPALPPLCRYQWVYRFGIDRLALASDHFTPATSTLILPMTRATAPSGASVCVSDQAWSVIFT